MDETQGFLYLGHSNWTICSLLRIFGSKMFPPSNSLRGGVEILLPQSWKWEKWVHRIMDESQWFLSSGHSNWTFCSLWSGFCSKMFPPSRSVYWRVQFLLPQRRKREKGIHQKMDETQGFLSLWYSNWTICSLLSGFYTGESNSYYVKWILFQNVSTLLIFILVTPILINPELKMRKRDSSKNGWDTWFLYLGHSNWTIAQCAAIAQPLIIFFSSSHRTRKIVSPILDTLLSLVRVPLIKGFVKFSVKVSLRIA